MYKHIPAFFKPNPKEGWTKEAIIRIGGRLLGVLLLGIAALFVVLWLSKSIAQSWQTYDEASFVYEEQGMYGETAPYARGAKGYDVPSMPAFSEEDFSYETNAVSPLRSYADIDTVLSSYASSQDTVSGGLLAELYEKTSYTVFFETRLLEKTCESVAALKPLSYVIFDSASEDARWCSYQFRVEKAHANEVADALRALNPKEFSLYTATQAPLVESHDTMRVQFERRQESLARFMQDVESAYDTLAERALAKGSVSEFTTLVTNRLATTERLQREMQALEDNVSALDIAAGSIVENTEYEHFSVTVSKYVLIDTEALGSEWRMFVNETLFTLNRVVLWMTLGLLTVALQAGVFILFVACAILSLVFVSKHLARMVRTTWKD